MGGRLYFGDNLHVLREYVKDESVDLIYLDPPFNSKASYNVLFRNPTGAKSQAQIRAFEDTWHWGPEAATAYEDVLASQSPAAGILRALRTFLGENDVMAYLAMMTLRLIEMHRVLKPTGSMYLHCDPTASHYLKIVLDGIFGVRNFQNEVVWKRTSGKSDYAQGAVHWPRLHDVLFLYRKDSNATVPFRPTFAAYDDDYVHSKYPHTEVGGRRYGLWDMTGPGGAAKGNPLYEVMGVTRYWRFSQDRMAKLIAEGRVVQPRPGAVPRYKRYLDEMPGVVVGDVWDDLSPVNSQAKERLGYQTQKPLALLERIIAASCEPGDTVLDPFCGCGTAVHAAEKHGLNWIGIDITHVAIQIIEDRLRSYFPGRKFPVYGRPTDLEGAAELAHRDKYQFQWWATWLAGGVPRGGERKGADRGIDGEMYFKVSAREDGKAVISVKGGHSIGPSMIRDLSGTVQAENAELGVFVTLAEPTAEMKKAASAAGFWDGPQGRYMKIQIKTIKELLDGRRPDTPPLYSTVTAAEAGRQAAARNLREPKKSDRRQKHMLLPLEGKSPRQSKSKKNLFLDLDVPTGQKLRRAAK